MTSKQRKTDKNYYKIINDNTGYEVYAECDLPFKADKLCEFLGLDGYHAETISKEEYYAEVDDEGGDQID